MFVLFFMSNSFGLVEGMGWFFVGLKVVEGFIIVMGWIVGVFIIFMFVCIGLVGKYS